MMDALARRRLGAVVALVVGAFLALALLPLNVTGPLGTVLGPALWRAFGLGAIGAPLLGILIGLAGFDRLPRLDMKRAAILTAGGMLLVPYTIGVLGHVNQAAFLPVLSDWSWSARLTGWVPGWFAETALASIGVAGALLAGFVVLTMVTLGTLAWHPLQRLERGAAAAATDEAGAAARTVAVPAPPGATAEPDEPEDVFVAPPRSPKAPKKSAKRKTAQAEEDDALPPLELLTPAKPTNVEADRAELQRLGQLLLDTLKTFKVDATLAGFTSGPTVTQFEVVPASGVKAGRIVALADDLAITMRAASLRVAPIPGRGAVGVEIPNPTPRMVTLRELLETPEFQDSSATLPIVLGRDVQGRPVVADLARMPHLLVAGATGSGKSVAINTIITALAYKYTARELRFLMVDPKMVELSIYNDLPHLGRQKVVTDNSDAARVFKWAVQEMNRRYALLHANGARNLAEFNAKVHEGKPLRNPAGARPTLTTISREAPDTPPEPPAPEEYTEGAVPMIVLVVDELADLMMTVQGEVETPMAMLAQKARAIGIHLILATQRPSVNVLTGLIKANFPSRIAFRVASKVDSRTIIDQNGAEALLGNGDMLFLPPGRNEPMRLQGAFIGTDETERLMQWYEERRGSPGHAVAEDVDIVELMRAQEAAEEGGGPGGDGERDPLFRQAAETCVQHQGGSTSLLQRRLGIGYGRAARIIDQLHDAGILGPPNGSKPRDVMIALHQLDEYTG